MVLALPHTLTVEITHPRINQAIFTSSISVIGRPDDLKLYIYLIKLPFPDHCD